MGRSLIVYFTGNDSENELPGIFTPMEVMDILNIGKNTMYTLLNTGELKGFRVGRSWRISAQSLEQFMQLEQGQLLLKYNNVQIQLIVYMILDV